jgi:hypothetical protein
MKRNRSLFDGQTPALTPELGKYPAPPVGDAVAAKLYRMLLKSERENEQLKRALATARRKLKFWQVRGMMKRFYSLKVGEAR